MERELNLAEVSDGRLYTRQDMVRVGCHDCEGCSDCCRGMEDTIVLDPYDCYRMTEGFGKTFDELLGRAFDLKMTDGLVLPHLRFDEKTESCIFLNEEGRCMIHSIRPGICRLFPLARIYEGDDFHYFLQIHECPAKNKTKVKVEKWLDTPNMAEYEAYLKSWHHLTASLRETVASMPEEEPRRKKLLLYFLKKFYQESWGDDFYRSFRERAPRFAEIFTP